RLRSALPRRLTRGLLRSPKRSWGSSGKRGASCCVACEPSEPRERWVFLPWCSATLLCNMARTLGSPTGPLLCPASVLASVICSHVTSWASVTSEQSREQASSIRMPETDTSVDTSRSTPSRLARNAVASASVNGRRLSLPLLLRLPLTLARLGGPC